MSMHPLQRTDGDRSNLLLSYSVINVLPGCASIEASPHSLVEGPAIQLLRVQRILCETLWLRTYQSKISSPFALLLMDDGDGAFEGRVKGEHLLVLSDSVLSQRTLFITTEYPHSWAFALVI